MSEHEHEHEDYRDLLTVRPETADDALDGVRRDDGIDDATVQRSYQFVKMTPWRNRILRYELVPPDQLLANPFNWRGHPDHQQKAMEGIMNTLGWLEPVIVNDNSAHMVNGHMRTALAIANGEPAIPVCFVDLNDDEERIALITYDTISQQAYAIRENLAELLRDVTTDDAALNAMFDELRLTTADIPAHAPLPDMSDDPDAVTAGEGGRRMTIIIGSATEFQAAGDEIRALLDEHPEWEATIAT